jgi:hypothetical protein
MVVVVMVVTVIRITLAVDAHDRRGVAVLRHRAHLPAKDPARGQFIALPISC